MTACSWREALKTADRMLQELGEEEAKASAWQLMEHVSGMRRAAFFLHADEEVPEEVLRGFLELVKKRQSRIPLQYILHEAWFMGFPFYVDKRVLIPRQDTENLVERVLKKQEEGAFREEPCLLDMCTGSGCIAVSLRKLGCFSEVSAADISPDALAVAGRNAENLGCRDVRLLESNLFDNLEEEQFDVIVCNPPYIRSREIRELMPEVRDHEPHLALDGTEDGLAFYRRLAKESPLHLQSGGWLFLEIGYDQGADVEKLLTDAGFREVRILRDDAGNERIAEGRWLAG